MRTVVDGPGNVFYVTTDNGSGRDAILAVRPVARRPPAEVRPAIATIAAQASSATTATTGTHRGCGVHQAQAATNSPIHTTTSSATAHHGANSRLAR